MGAPKVTDEELRVAIQAYKDNGNNQVEAAKSLGMNGRTFNGRLKMAEERLDFKIKANGISDDELIKTVEAYYENGGNKAEAARAVGLRYSTYKNRLEIAEQTLGLKLGKVAEGHIEASESVKLRLPKKGHIKRYILTSMQNNTHLHPGFSNLVAYCDWFNRKEKSECDIFIGTYSYQLAAYGPKAVKRGTYRGKSVNEELWYDKEAEPYIRDESIELAPGLVWCGEQNIIPTQLHPLTQFEDYNGRKSNIVPHSKIALESITSLADEPTKFNYSTGTITQRNYIQKRAGILAEKKHTYGALLVEVDWRGSWWVRQLHIDKNNEIMDTGPKGYAGVHIHDEKVEAKKIVESIYWGDAHAAELELWVRNLGWGEDGMLDDLQPRYQFIADVFSMRTMGHHEIKNFHKTYGKHVDGEASVEDEVQLTADFMNEANRDWCEMVVIAANHDRHLDRWLNEADFRADPLNAKYFLELQWQMLNAMDEGNEAFNIMEYALLRAGVAKDIRFLGLDEGFILKGIENSLHGDLGPNGSRGSTRGLTKLGRPINKGHDHTAAIRDQVYSSGACSLSFPYMVGPNSHSVSHILTYENGTRAIVTMWSHDWRA